MVLAFFASVCSVYAVTRVGVVPKFSCNFHINYLEKLNFLKNLKNKTENAISMPPLPAKYI